MYKARLMFAKQGTSKFISHLDLMQTIQRSMARANLPVWYTEGFNPHIYVSIAMPLPTGFSSQCELVDFNFLTDDVPADAMDKLNASLPFGITAKAIYANEKAAKFAIFSQYKISYTFDSEIENFASKVNDLFAQDEVIVVKRTKRSEKEVNIKEMIQKLTASGSGTEFEVDCILAVGNINLNPEYITKAIEKYLDIKPMYAAYERTEIFDEKLNIFR